MTDESQVTSCISSHRPSATDSADLFLGHQEPAFVLKAPSSRYRGGPEVRTKGPESDWRIDRRVQELAAIHLFGAQEPKGLQSRPRASQLYALKHNDITIEKDPKRLLVTVRNGKTGYRVANTMAGAVSAYERIKARYPDAQGEDYLFLPDYPNRATASQIFQRQFNQPMDDTKLKFDPSTDMERSVYSLRPTAICMRIILSHGKVNIFDLAKNAGTSVEQIERF